MRDYYTEFLQRKISENIQTSEVSKVSKGQNVIEKHTFDTFDTALSGVNQKNFHSEIISAASVKTPRAEDSFFHARQLMQSYRPEKSISQTLDAMIKSGAAFDVAEHNFEVIGSKYLTEQQRQYLTANGKEALCTLHQRLLMKHWFYDSPELLESFAFDIFERESILAEETGYYAYETYLGAVSETSRKWFADLLNSTDEFAF